MKKLLKSYNTLALIKINKGEVKNIKKNKESKKLKNKIKNFLKKIK